MKSRENKKVNVSISQGQGGIDAGNTKSQSDQLISDREALNQLMEKTTNTSDDLMIN